MIFSSVILYNSMTFIICYFGLDLRANISKKNLIMSRTGYSVDLLVRIDMCFNLVAFKSNTCRYHISSLIQSMFGIFYVYLNITSSPLLSLIPYTLSNTIQKYDSYILCCVNSTPTGTISLVKFKRNYCVNLSNKTKEMLVRLTLLAKNKVVFL